MASPPKGAFANADQLVRGWYVVARAKHVRRDRLQTWDVLDRRITLWRGGDGKVAALDARCPHLGADLGQGTVVDGQLRCAFHHWCFDRDGRCTHARGDEQPPHRFARMYPTRESHGLVWIYNGNTPRFEPPEPPASVGGVSYRRWLPPSQTLNCHPHLVIGNGLDARHFAALHGMEVTKPPACESLGEHRLRLHLQGRPTNRWLSRLLGTRRQPIVSSFTTLGSSTAWAHVEQPISLHVLFTARPEPGGRCTTQTVFYLPRGLGVREIRAVLLMMSLLHSDRRVLERLEFHRGFTEADEPMRRFVERVDAMEVEA